MKKHNTVQLSHGGGGVEMNHLIRHLFWERFGNDILNQAEDAATLTLPSPLAMTTDSFTVSPHFFAGGNIGTLAIAGTCNDLAMVAAKPSYLSCSFIIEEGTPVQELEIIVDAMAAELSVCGTQIVCGDTKVVPRGAADKVFINTTGIGQILKTGVSAHRIQAGDVILVSRDIGCHGACILAARESLRLAHPITSDCAVLWPVVESLLEQSIDVHAMRDATRGGLSAVLNEWCQSSGLQLAIQEAQIPVDDAVRGLCELCGFEPYDLANEGTFVIAVPPTQVQHTLDVLHQFNARAAVIGEAVSLSPAKPILHTAWGSRRYLDFPAGELLPRIC
ncbi:hydrogenase expression/formation protein HypE [Vibrio mangrovi]|uniref:Hydrogenase expression/formation protein HypE n=1 Tax=Vibrio mangrovi TaxID=474394 RepID=A0A1Y6J285_9VIBR|nr:hydrogenase expression/formation protein HypE [Vibrio mangrovi]MDW6002020.1 hydrogenase expression/formation protein HypE [Vibrio mangrovi]SMS02433.1 Hydrogenase isoenzymes formation protein HypE [Vibrio mangrovi]